MVRSQLYYYIGRATLVDMSEVHFTLGVVQVTGGEHLLRFNGKRDAEIEAMSSVKNTFPEHAGYTNHVVEIDQLAEESITNVYKINNPSLGTRLSYWLSLRWLTWKH